MARFVAALLFLAGVSLPAQDIISARAGYLNYQEGQPALERRQLQQGETFRGQGRTELLLTAGSFLRLDQNSEIRMLSTRLSEVQVELVEGTVSVEVNELPKLARLTLVWGERSFPIEHTGLYRFQAQNGLLRVAVQQGKLRLPGLDKTLKGGHGVEVSSGGISSAAKFDRHADDSFDLWSRSRAELLSVASLRSAHSLNTRGFAFRNSLWAFNSFLGCYTYLPYSAYITSPWGFPFYSPRFIWIYAPPYGGGHGPGRANGGGGGTSQGGVATPSGPAPRVDGPPRVRDDRPNPRVSEK